jgi:iron transport multicopper oxidase
MMSIYNLLVLVVAALLPSIHAATVTYDFNITWTLANPDGLFTRAVIGVNGKWPPPTIYATKGDQVVVNVKNQLGNQTTGLHFHGIFQNGTTEMDGAAYITQCPIQPGGSLTYNFTVSLPTQRTFHFTDVSDRSTWHLLVPFPRPGPVS